MSRGRSTATPGRRSRILSTSLRATEAAWLRRGPRRASPPDRTAAGRGSQRAVVRRSRGGDSGRGAARRPSEGSRSCRAELRGGLGRAHGPGQSGRCGNPVACWHFVLSARIHTSGAGREQPLRCAEERPNALIPQAVKCVPPTPSALDEAAVEQAREVVRGVGLREPGLIHNLSDGSLARPERLKD